MLGVVAFILGLFVAVPAPAKQPTEQVRPGAPRLLVVISVDQLSAELFDEYRPHFTGGLARLARLGVRPEPWTPDERLDAGLAVLVVAADDSNVFGRSQNLRFKQLMNAEVARKLSACIVPFAE